MLDCFQVSGVSFVVSVFLDTRLFEVNTEDDFLPLPFQLCLGSNAQSSVDRQGFLEQWDSPLPECLVLTPVGGVQGQTSGSLHYMKVISRL